MENEDEPEPEGKEGQGDFQTTIDNLSLFGRGAVAFHTHCAHLLYHPPRKYLYIGKGKKRGKGREGLERKERDIAKSPTTPRIYSQHKLFCCILLYYIQGASCKDLFPSLGWLYYLTLPPSSLPSPTNLTRIPALPYFFLNSSREERKKRKTKKRSAKTRGEEEEEASPPHPPPPLHPPPQLSHTFAFY